MVDGINFSVMHFSSSYNAMLSAVYLLTGELLILAINKVRLKIFHFDFFVVFLTS